ncbi:MAG: division/cell wall cluster transcriptional repressor MraZ [Candidatus Helarchaeota archaeon]|nr:division/cell wall cluster transcriptional repressor MraZ [Candidatus Helarchaeota archaeon]
MSSFKGQFKYTIDSKGRINIPAKFRKSISPEANETFVITRGMENCIYAYPLDEWNKIEEKLRQLSPNQKDHRLFLRMTTSYASESQFDKQGRIAIPQHLIDLVKIKKEILIIGTLNKLEIWNPEVYEEYLKSSEESYENLAEKI